VKTTPKQIVILTQLEVCPFCSNTLEFHPGKIAKSCYTHGNFVITEDEYGNVKIEFQLLEKSDLYGLMFYFE